LDEEAYAADNATEKEKLLRMLRSYLARTAYSAQRTAHSGQRTTNNGSW